MYCTKSLYIKSLIYYIHNLFTYTVLLDLLRPMGEFSHVKPYGVVLCSSVVEGLLNRCNTLDLIPSTAKINKDR
jgi:hypothetical protein